MDISFERLISFFISKLKFVLVLSVVVTIATYLICDNFITKKYTSSSALMISMNLDANQTSSNELNVTKNLVENYIRTLYTTNFFTFASSDINEALGTNYTPKEIKDNTIIRTDSQKVSADFNIDYTSEDPALSQKILTILTAKAIAYIDNFEYTNKIAIIENPTYASAPSSPRLRIVSVYAFLITFIVSMAIFFFVEIFDNRIKNVQDISTEYNLSIIGVIPDYSPTMNAKRKKHRSYEDSYSTAEKEEQND